jgi:2,4-dienoyl-CoA reductase-like NADH-dependent reductase (Old Yellow Enzyme family)
LRNRLAKAAMSEGLAEPDGAPGERLCRLYRRWGQSQLGLIITGNASIDRHHLERPGNVIVEDESALRAFAAWAEVAQSGGAAAILQINHAGRQTGRVINPTPVGPSAVPAVKLLRQFGRPRAATADEIAALRAAHVRAARVAESAGFAGVQIHAAHGYLLNQFLAPDTNRRSDAYGGCVANRARLLVEIVREVREATRPGFAVAVKLNSSDFHEGGLSEDDAAEVARLLDGEGVDLLEISGGTYTRGASFGEGVAPSSRESYFLAFAERIRGLTKMPVMLTGGFRSHAAMSRAVAGGGTDVVGLARPLALEPELANHLLAEPDSRSRAKPLHFGIAKLRGAAELSWYGRQLARVADGHDPDETLSMGWSLVVRLTRDWLVARRLRRHFRER